MTCVTFKSGNRHTTRHHQRESPAPGSARQNRYTDPLHTASADRRHTTALHLLQAGVELNVIKSWLGHVSITTTSQYVEIDMAMKRKAIERCPAPVPTPEGESRWHARQDIIQWLEDLSAPKSYVKQNPASHSFKPDSDACPAQFHIISSFT